MAIKEVVYERLYGSASIQRLPSQYENERIGAIATVVDGDVAAAFAEARAEVEAENQRREAEYQEAQRQRHREEAEARRAANQNALRQQQGPAYDQESDPSF